jgi:hypothetical protein
VPYEGEPAPVRDVVSMSVGMEKGTAQQGWEACDKTDTLFVLTCTVFCWTIIPAVGLGRYSEMMKPPLKCH